MRRIDVRVYVIAALVVCAAALGAYMLTHPSQHQGGAEEPLFTQPAGLPPERIRSIVDTAAQMLGAPKKFIVRRSGADSGRTVLETSIGVPGSFDELRLIAALADSVRPGGITVAAVKNLKEKTTTIRFWNRDHTCIYRCILYRKELHH